MRIFHLVDRSVWTAAAAAGGRYVPSGYAAEGFVHFSFAHQVERTANALYRDEADLVLVEVDTDRLDVPLRVEDTYAAGEDFPHVYGPIPVAAVVAVHELTRDGAGAWRFTPGARDAGASPGR